MPSINIVRNLVVEAKGQTLILMQEGDMEEGFTVNAQWADEMYQAWDHLKETLTHLDRAELV